MHPRATSLLYTTHAGLACKSAREKKKRKKEPQEVFLLLLLSSLSIASFRVFARLLQRGAFEGRAQNCDHSKEKDEEKKRPQLGMTTTSAFDSCLLSRRPQPSPRPVVK